MPGIKMMHGKGHFTALSQKRILTMPNDIKVEDLLDTDEDKIIEYYNHYAAGKKFIN
ncbi:MAG: hypothetical protein WDN26_17590 [Chitinophagaceae bacterium]